MKVFFSNRSLSGWLTKRQIRWSIFSFVCLLGGSYLVGGHLGFLMFLSLPIAGICIARAVGGLRNWNNGHVTHRAFRMKKAPQIMSGWDYRPRDVIRRDAAVECEGAGIPRVARLRPSTPNENDNIWFNFKNPEAAVEEATTKTPLSDDARKGSTYD